MEITLKYQPQTQVKEVKVSGSFNNWTPIKMERKFNYFSKIINTEKEDIQFKFIVDGEWLCDESLPVCFDENGNKNNFISVGELREKEEQEVKEEEVKEEEVKEKDAGREEESKEEEIEVGVNLSTQAEEVIPKETIKPKEKRLDFIDSMDNSLDTLNGSLNPVQNSVDEFTTLTSSGNSLNKKQKKHCCVL